MFSFVRKKLKKFLRVCIFLRIQFGLCVHFIEKKLVFCDFSLPKWYNYISALSKIQIERKNFITSNLLIVLDLLYLNEFSIICV